MVFYDPLPTELWFIIYKMEHSSLLSNVNSEIKTLNREIELLNKNEPERLPASRFHSLYSAHCDWTIKQWSSFRLVHPTIFIHLDGILDIHRPQGAYGYGYDRRRRRKIVVEYMKDW